MSFRICLFAKTWPRQPRVSHQLAAKIHIYNFLNELNVQTCFQLLNPSGFFIILRNVLKLAAY